MDVISLKPVGPKFMLWKAGYTEGKQMWEVGEEERRERGRKSKSESKREPENQRECAQGSTC